MTRDYRQVNGVRAAHGIRFHHESPPRGEIFVARKITRPVTRTKSGIDGQHNMGNIDAFRDWGYAPEYVEAMWRILQNEEPTNLVVAIRNSHRVRDILQFVFSRVGLDWEKRVGFDECYLRPTQVDSLFNGSAKAARLQVWKS